MKVNFIEDLEKDYIIAFFPDNYKFFKTNKIVKDIVDFYEEGISIINICENLGISYDKCKNIIDKFEAMSSTKKFIIDDIKNKCSEKVLQKLVINVTDKCNLKCKYCYESIENSCENKNDITFNTIDRIFNIIPKKYNKIENIQLFGGEALLNISAIKYICKRLDELYKENILLSRPTLGLVSNGTIMNNEIIGVLKRYNIHLTISFDGEPNIHDKLRVFKNNTGTSESIIKNIRLLKKNYDLPLNFEVTYNQEHVKKNINFKDIISYLEKNFDAKNIHITPVLADKKKSFYLDNLSKFKKSTKQILNDKDIKIYPHKVNNLLLFLKNNWCSPYLCTAGINQLTISTNGDIYPCFMLIGAEKYKMGNINNKDVLDSREFRNIIGLLENNKKINNKKCKDCHMINLCTSCLGNNYFTNKCAFEPDERSCDINKDMLKEILFYICDKSENMKDNAQ